MKAIETIITLVLATCMLSLSYRCGKEAAKWDANAAAMRMVKPIIDSNIQIREENFNLILSESAAHARNRLYLEALADCRGWATDSIRVSLFVDTLHVGISDTSHYKGMRVIFTSVPK